MSSTGSTNDDLAAEARSGAVAPCVLVADHQTAGRGRIGRKWNDVAAGSLLMSVRLPGSVDDAIHRIEAVTAAARAAAAGAVSVPVLAKWPNDLVIDHPSAAGKLAGVLAEFVDGSAPVVVVGLGLNIAPVPGEPFATSLEEAGSTIGRDDLLTMVLDSLPGYLDDSDRARTELREASATIGRRVRVELTDSSAIVGVAHHIDDSGRLVIATDDGDRRVSVGDVFHLRPHAS